jgi:hypothetical protein
MGKADLFCQQGDGAMGDEATRRRGEGAWVGRYSPAIGLLFHEVRMPDREPWPSVSLPLMFTSDDDGDPDRRRMQGSKTVAGRSHLGENGTLDQGSQSGLDNEAANDNVFAGLYRPTHASSLHHLNREWNGLHRRIAVSSHPITVSPRTACALARGQSLTDLPRASE